MCIYTHTYTCVYTHTSDCRSTLKFFHVLLKTKNPLLPWTLSHPWIYRKLGALSIWTTSGELSFFWLLFDSKPFYDIAYWPPVSRKSMISSSKHSLSIVYLIWKALKFHNCCHWYHLNLFSSKWEYNQREESQGPLLNVLKKRNIFLLSTNHISLRLRL